MSTGSLTGCLVHEGATVEQLKSRAAFDMDCPKSEIKYVDIDDDTRGVSGCGQHMTYIQSCRREYGSEECTWVLNNGTVRAHEDSH